MKEREAGRANGSEVGLCVGVEGQRKREASFGMVGRGGEAEESCGEKQKTRAEVSARESGQLQRTESGQ